MSTPQNKPKRAKYPSDMTKNGWKKLKAVLPAPKPRTEKGGRPPADLKEVINGGYRGEELSNWVSEVWGWIWQVVLRSDDAKGFVLLPRRWVVERTFAWFNHARRLSKDYEFNPTHSQSMVYIASIRIMMNRF